MIADITLGQYFPGTSALHKMDPRTKILLSLLYMVSVFCAKNALVFAFLCACTVILVLISKIKVRVILRSLRPIVFVMLFTAAISLFLTPGEGDPLFSFWIFTAYKEGVIRAVFLAIRVILLVAGVSLFLTYTTSPMALTDGIESLLSPLKVFKISVHVFAMMMTIALRFIPTLIDETDKIIKAQKSRGADFSSGGLIKRAKALIPILIPLLVSSFQHALDLATAMECRCYTGGSGRTKLRELKMRTFDFISLFVGAIVLAFTIWGNYTFTDWISL